MGYFKIYKSNKKIFKDGYFESDGVQKTDIKEITASMIKNTQVITEVGDVCEVRKNGVKYHFSEHIFYCHKNDYMI